MIEEICDLVVDGLSADNCARFAGISPSTMHAWKAEGEEERLRREKGDEPNPALNLKAEFSERYDLARAAYELKLIRILMRQSVESEQDPKVIQWLLTKKYSEYRDIARTEVTGADGGPVKTETTVVSDAELLDLANRIAGLGPVIPAAQVDPAEPAGEDGFVGHLDDRAYWTPEQWAAAEAEGE